MACLGPGLAWPLLRSYCPWPSQPRIFHLGMSNREASVGGWHDLPLQDARPTGALREGRDPSPALQKTPWGAQPTCFLARLGGGAGGQAQPRLHDPPGRPLRLHMGARRRLSLRGLESPALQGSLRPPARRRAPTGPSRPFLCPSPRSAAATEHGCRRGAPRPCPVHQHHLGAVRVDGGGAQKAGRGLCQHPWGHPVDLGKWPFQPCPWFPASVSR